MYTWKHIDMIDCYVGMLLYVISKQLDDTGHADLGKSTLARRR